MLSLTQFERELRLREYAENTISKYVKDIQALLTVLGETCNGVCKEDLIAYKHLLTERLSPASVNRKIAAINCWLALSGLEHLRLKALKIQQKNFTEKELTKREFSRLVNTAMDSGQIQTALIMLTLAATGIRVSELRFITVKAVRQGTATIRSKGKVRCIPLPTDLQADLLAYCKARSLRSGPVFVSRSGMPLSRTYIAAQMKKAARAAGVNPAKVYPHNLRHYFSRRFLERGYAVTDLADHLGHSSVDTTRRYLLTSTVAMQRKLTRIDIYTRHAPDGLSAVHPLLM